jgi:taurine--2-oxoglutarate transaminase
MAIAERDCVLHSWSVQSDWDAPTGGRRTRRAPAPGRRPRDPRPQQPRRSAATWGTSIRAWSKAIRAQAERLCFVTSAWGAEPRAQLAQALLERSGVSQGGRVYFTLGGADAPRTR